MSASKRINAVGLAMFEALRQGAISYANGRTGAPIVDQHFTAGNQGRYGWAPLSKAYFDRKSGISVKGSRKDKNAAYQTKSGSATGTNLPMLVRTGALRAAVGSKSHLVTQDAATGNVTVLFTALPDYALYLHDGTEKMPKRSPVMPNEQDVAAVMAVTRNYLDKRLSILKGMK